MRFCRPVRCRASASATPAASRRSASALPVGGSGPRSASTAAERSRMTSSSTAFRSWAAATTRRRSVPNTEGLEEVRVISNNFSAEYGRGQAVISMSTKSGTNAFTATAPTCCGTRARRQQFSNNAQGIPKREFRVHDYGGSIGGPILRNKLFFFSSYHLLRNDQTITSLLTVPTALERVGNFSQTFIRDENGNPVPPRIFDPFAVVQQGADLYRRANSRRHHSQPGPGTRCGCTASIRCRTARRTTCSTRATSRRPRCKRFAGTARTTASTSSGRTTRSTAAAASRMRRS